MIKELETIRKELYNQLQSGKRENRRATSQAFKLINKACNLLKLPKFEKTRSFRNDTQTITYPPTTEVKEVAPIKTSDVIATNTPEEVSGPEKPKRTRTPKAKAV
jgi:phosphoribosylformylglycinamidine (FGAM) synthase-like enzyme